MESCLKGGDHCSGLYDSCLSGHICLPGCSLQATTDLDFSHLFDVALPLQCFFLRNLPFQDLLSSAASLLHRGILSFSKSCSENAYLKPASDYKYPSASTCFSIWSSGWTWKPLAYSSLCFSPFSGCPLSAC